MSKSMWLCAMAVISGQIALCAPRGGEAPVAAGYPAWTGLTPKNYIAGRVLVSGGDLRQRITVVVEFDAAKTAEQLEKTGTLSELCGFRTATGLSPCWEKLVLPRDVMVIYVARNVKSHEAVIEGMKAKDRVKQTGLTALEANGSPVYEQVSFNGAPSAEGQYPFVYVMGCEGVEPLLKTAFKGKQVTANAIRKVIASERKKLKEANLSWRPFYGYACESKHCKDVENALKGVKSLEPLEAKLLAEVLAGDAEAAKEAQMLYDGLEQAKSDMIWVARKSMRRSPHVAAHKLGMLVKYWPSAKKSVADLSDKLKAKPGSQPLVKMYPKIAQWSDPGFVCKNAGEAKKIVAELNKMKKTLEPLKESADDVNVQNGALLMDGMVDELIATIPSKVQ